MKANLINLNVLKKYIIKLCIITLIISSIPFGIIANADQNNQTLTSKSIDLLNQTTNEVNHQEFLNIESLFINDLKNTDFNIQIPHEKLNLENISILSIEDNYTSITVPINSDEYNLLSNITFIYDSDMNLVTYQESHVTRSINDTFTFTTYQDGKIIRNEISEIEYISNEEFEEGIKELETLENLRSTGACLAAVLGVSGVVGNTIAKMCAGACVLVVTMKVCVACIGAYAVVGGASIGAVASCF